MILRFLATLAMLLWLTACSSGAPPRPGDTLFDQLPGGQFTLHRDITIAPGRVRVIFQGGNAAYGASEFLPRCELEVRQILESPQTVAAGSYRIGKVFGIQRYVNHPTGRILLAAAGDPGRLAGTFNEWSMYTYHMQLLNAQQAHAATLICGGSYNDPFHVRYPSLQEMQGALGNYATLTLD
jgi:hypothetical protein